MSVHAFGIETVRNQDATDFMSESAERARGLGLHSYFADWFIIELSATKDRAAWVVMVSSGFPDAWKLAAGIALLPLLFTGFVWSWWVVPGLSMWVLSFFSSATMRYIALRIALRKHGYRGKVKRLYMPECLRRMVLERWGRKK